MSGYELRYAQLPEDVPPPSAGRKVKLAKRTSSDEPIRAMASPRDGYRGPCLSDSVGSYTCEVCGMNSLTAEDADECCRGTIPNWGK